MHLYIININKTIINEWHSRYYLIVGCDVQPVFAGM